MRVRFTLSTGTTSLTLPNSEPTFDPGHPTQARHLAGSAAAPRKTREQTDKVRDGSANQAAFAAAEQMLAGVRSELMAPRKVLEAKIVELLEARPAT